MRLINWDLRVSKGFLGSGLNMRSRTSVVISGKKKGNDIVKFRLLYGNASSGKLSFDLCLETILPGGGGPVWR